MKKLLFLLTAITSVSFAVNTLTVEAGANGNPTTKKLDAPFSIGIKHESNGFAGSLKISESPSIDFAASTQTFDWQNTKLEGNLNYTSQSYNYTVFDFDLSSDSQLKAGTFNFSGETGLTHDLVLFKVGERLKYSYENGSTNELTAKVTFDLPLLEKYTINTYFEGGYDFQNSKSLFNAKLGASLNLSDSLTYKPYFETKNKFKTVDSTNTFELGAVTYKLKDLTLDTSLKYILKYDPTNKFASSVSSSVSAKYVYKFTDNVVFTPSMKLGFDVDLTKDASGALKPSYALKPEAKLTVDQTVSDKISLTYELSGKLGSYKYEYKGSTYSSSVNDPNLGAKLTFKYAF